MESNTLKKIKKNPILELDFYDLDVTAFFLNKHRKAFIEEIMEFGYSKPSATKMAARITQTISFQCLRNL
jgi:phage-related protein